MNTWSVMVSDIYVITIIIVGIMISNIKRDSKIARHYVNGHLVNFYVCFLIIYLGIGAFFAYVPYITAPKLIGSGLLLVIYLLVIGEIINFIIKHIKIKNSAYKIDNNERFFIVCTNIIIILIIYALGNREYLLEILAIFLGRFLWIDTMYGKSIGEIVNEIRVSIKVRHRRLSEIVGTIMIGEVFYYTVMIILETHYSNEISVNKIHIILPWIIALLIIVYGVIGKRKI